MFIFDDQKIFLFCCKFKNTFIAEDTFQYTFYRKTKTYSLLFSSETLLDLNTILI